MGTEREDDAKLDGRKRLTIRDAGYEHYHVRELEQELMRLPAAERARLAERLIASLDEDTEIEAVWAAEVRRRDAELHAARRLPRPPLREVRMNREAILSNAEQVRLNREAIRRNEGVILRIEGRIIALDTRVARLEAA